MYVYDRCIRSNQAFKLLYMFSVPWISEGFPKKNFPFLCPVTAMLNRSLKLA
jgi:hypothetical protein